jgi:hypothetical protein
MLFNQQETINFSEIKNQTDIDEAVLKQMLHSLACNKYKILAKTGEDRSISDKDEFTVNEKFSAKLNRLTIPVPEQKETF